MKAGSGLTVKRMLNLAHVSRASFYRFNGNGESGPDRDMDLRDAIQRIALEWPSYGRRRVTAELRRQGWTVNPKRVYRLMHEDNLLCVRKRKFVVTTDSNHGRKVYPNLAANMVLTGMDQLWRADITYVRLRDEFVFVAVILDAYSGSAKAGWPRRWRRRHAGMDFRCCISGPPGCSAIWKWHTPTAASGEYC